MVEVAACNNTDEKPHASSPSAPAVSSTSAAATSNPKVHTVTAIDAVSADNCSDSAPPPSGSRIVRIEIDAQALHPIPYSTLPPGSLLSSDNWYEIDGRGYGTKPKVAVGCGDHDPGPFYKPLDTEQKGRGSILLASSAESTVLELHFNRTGRDVAVASPTAVSFRSRTRS